MTRWKQSTIRRGLRVYACPDCGQKYTHDDAYRHATRTCPKLALKKGKP